MKEPSPPHTLPPQHSNTTNLLNRNFPGVTAMNLASHFHIVNMCCHGANFSPLLANVLCDWAGDALHKDTMSKGVQFTS